MSSNKPKLSAKTGSSRVDKRFLSSFRKKILKMWLKTLIFSVLLVYTIKAAPITESGDNKKMVQFLKKSLPAKRSTYRLPRNTVPRVYVIELDPDFLKEKFTFTGKCTIIFEVLHPSTSVTLHKSQNIDIDKNATELVHMDGKTEKPLQQTWRSQNEFYTMKFENKLNIGNYTLNMQWTGVDSSNNWFDIFSGFYRAEYKDEKGNPSYLVTTHFEPTRARNAFPCWDEPGLKAEFEISIKHFSNFTALSNMPMKNREELPDGKVLSHFERSIKMSPYLPCFLVADYKAIKNKNGNITFYTIEKDLQLVKYALEMSEKTIPVMENYTDIPYAMPKLDQITVPQYEVMATEHWGLVSYLTNAVLLQNTTLIPNIVDEDRIAFIVAHELAHQWFGNLVSPAWWDDLWLNEAFAAYFQYKILDQIFPHWRMMDYFVIENNNRRAYNAERYSALPRPIKYNPTTKIEIKNMFSLVTYRKGSAVVHMLEHIVTEEVFREGIQNYLKKHQFEAVVTNDLWEALQDAYDKKFQEDKKLNIRSTMDPWLEQTGYPVLTVTRDNLTDDIVITQKNGASTVNDNRWRIPINYATKSNPDFSSTIPTMWMERNQIELRIPNVSKNDWIIVNIQQRGFYKIKYDEENWENLIDYLLSDDFKSIHPVNRAELINNIIKMPTRDDSNLGLFLKMSLYLHQERDYLVWIPAGRIMKELSHTLRNTPEEDLFGLYLLIVTNEVTEHLGFEHHEGDEHSAIKIRSTLAPLLCEFKHADCITFAHRMFNSYLENPSKDSFPPSEWGWILCSGLRESNESVWDKFMFTDMPMNEFIKKYKYALIRCAQSDDQRDKYITQIMQKNSTVDPDQMTMMFETFFRGKTRDVDYAMDYIINHIDDIEKYYDQYEDADIQMLIKNMGYTLKTDDQINKYKEFLKSKKVSSKTGSNNFDFPTLNDLFRSGKDESKLEELKKFGSLFREKLTEILGTEAIDAGRKLQKLKPKV